MYIDEYLTQHPELVPEGRDLMEFALECEHYIGFCRDLVPYSAPNYVEEVFKLCIECNGDVAQRQSK